MSDEFLKVGKYFEVYQRVFQFHKKHRNPKTNEDWITVIDDLKQFKTEFEIEMAVAIMRELERHNM